jgi:hypothetical protein
MIKKLIAALAATPILASGFAEAQYYEPIDGQYYSTPSHHQYQRQSFTPQYHNYPRNMGDLMDNEMFMNDIALRARAISGPQRELTPQEARDWEVHDCRTQRFVLGYATLGLYGIYSLMFNEPCEDVLAQPRPLTVSAKPANDVLQEDDRRTGSGDLADLQKKDTG